MANQIPSPLLVLHPGLLGAGGRLGHTSLFLEMSRLSGIALYCNESTEPLLEFLDELDISVSSDATEDDSGSNVEQQHDAVVVEQDHIAADEPEEISANMDRLKIEINHDVAGTAHVVTSDQSAESTGVESLAGANRGKAASSTADDGPTTQTLCNKSGKNTDLPGYTFSENTLKLFDTLTKLSIEYRTEEYREKPHRLNADPQIFYCKNLFLKDRKGQYYLYICHEDIDVDLKQLRKDVKAFRNFNFGTADELLTILGVVPGGVTPLALMNGNAKHVRMVVSESLVREGASLMFHPLDANLATRITLFSLLRFLKHFDHAVDFVP